METIELMNMCMIVDEARGMALMQNRVKGSWTGWAFPGGHIEPGESIVDSTVREVGEETGLAVDSLRLVGVKDWYDAEKNERAIVFLFRTSVFSGRLIEHGEEGDVAWFPLDALPFADMPYSMNYAVEVLLNDGLNEHYMNKDESGGWVHMLK